MPNTAFQGENGPLTALGGPLVPADHIRDGGGGGVIGVTYGF